MQTKGTLLHRWHLPHHLLIKATCIPGGIVLLVLLDIWTHDFGTSLQGPGTQPIAGFSLLSFYLLYMLLILLRSQSSSWSRWHFISIYLLATLSLTLVTAMFFSSVLRMVGYTTIGVVIIQARNMFGKIGFSLVCSVLLFTVSLNTFFLWGQYPPLELPTSLLPVGLWLIALAFFQTFTTLGVHERTTRIRNEQLIRLLLVTQQQLRIYAAHAEELAATRERMHAAREIHDTQAQGFAAIKMHLETCKLVFEPASDQAYHHLEQARLLAGDYLTKTRLSIAALRTELPQEQPLQQILIQMENTQQMHDLTIDVHISPQVQTLSIPGFLAQAYARITEEALNNAHTHGHAHSIAIELSLEIEALCLTITDNGIGFEPLSPEIYRQSGHFGIVGMYERAHAIQGHLDLISTPGMGTQVVIVTSLQHCQNGILL